jgi:hypothetical protein
MCHTLLFHSVYKRQTILLIRGECRGSQGGIPNLVARIFLWERPWLVKNLVPEGVWAKYQITSTCFQWDIRSGL